MNRRAFAGRKRRAAQVAARRPDTGQSLYVPVAVVRARLRPRWAEAHRWPQLEEDDRRDGLLVKIRGEIKDLGLDCYHTAVSLGSDSGYPDLTVWGPGGILWREVKGSDGRVKVNQLERVERIRAAGGDAGFWWPEDWYAGVIRAELVTLTERRPGVVPLPALAPELTALGALLADAPPLPPGVAAVLAEPAGRPRGLLGPPVREPGRFYRFCGCEYGPAHRDDCPRYGRGVTGQNGEP